MPHFLLSQLPFTNANSEGSLIQQYIDSIRTLEIIGSECINALNQTPYFQALFNFLKLAEGFRNQAYLDEVANPPVMTIGIGYNLDQSGARDVISNQLHLDYAALRSGQISLTDAQVGELLRISLIERAGALKERLRIGDLLQHRFKGHQLLALQSMAFTNSNLIGRHLMSVIQQNDDESVSRVIVEILEYSNRQNNVGVANRRLKEAAMFYGDAHEVKITWRCFQKLKDANNDIKIQGPNPHHGLPVGDFKNDYKGKEEKVIASGIDDEQIDQTVYGSKHKDEYKITRGHQVVFGGDGDDMVEVSGNYSTFLALNKGFDRYKIASHSKNVFIYDLDEGVIEIDGEPVVGLADQIAENLYSLKSGEHTYRLSYLNSNETLHETLMIQQENQTLSVYLAPYNNGIFNIYLTKKTSITDLNIKTYEQFEMNYLSNEQLAVTSYKKSGLSYKIVTDLFDANLNKISSMTVYDRAAEEQARMSIDVMFGQFILKNDQIVHVLQYDEQDSPDYKTYIKSDLKIYDPKTLGLVTMKKIMQVMESGPNPYAMGFRPVGLALNHGGFVLNQVTSDRMAYGDSIFMFNMQLVFFDAHLNEIIPPIKLLDPEKQSNFLSVESCLTLPMRKLMAGSDNTVLFFYYEPKIDNIIFQLKFMKLSEQGQILQSNQFGEWPIRQKKLMHYNVAEIGEKIILQLFETEYFFDPTFYIIQKHSLYFFDQSSLTLSAPISFIPPRNTLTSYPLADLIFLKQNNALIRFGENAGSGIPGPKFENYWIKIDEQEKITVLSNSTQWNIPGQKMFKWQHARSKKGNVASLSAWLEPSGFSFDCNLEIKLLTDQNFFKNPDHKMPDYFARNMLTSSANQTMPATILFYSFVAICMIGIIKACLRSFTRFYQQQDGEDIARPSL